MSSKYVPPAMRNKQNQQRKFEKSQPPVEEPKVCEMNDTNFPALGEVPKKVTVWGGTKSFAELASEWKDKDDSDELVKQHEEQKKSQQPTYTYRQNVPLPKFHNVRRFIEPEDVEESAKPIDKKEDDEGWTVVDRTKVRREKTFEERIAQLEKNAKNESMESNEQTEQEYESVWDN